MSPPRQTPSSTRAQTVPAQTQVPIATQILPSNHPGANPPVKAIAGVMTAGIITIIVIVVIVGIVAYYVICKFTW